MPKKTISKTKIPQNRECARQPFVWLQPSRLARSIPAALGLLVAVYGCVWLVDQASMIYEQQRMESYLEKKYNEKFVVDSPQYMNGGIAVEGIWKAEAYPQSNNQLKFEVSGNSYGLSDQYVAAIWSVEANEELQKDFNKIYDKNLDSYANATVTLSDDLVRTATTSSPSYSEAKTARTGFSYTLRLSTSNITPDKFRDEYDRVRQLVETLRTQHIKSITLDASILSLDGVEYRCIAAESRYGDKIPDNLSECYDKGR